MIEMLDKYNEFLLRCVKLLLIYGKAYGETIVLTIGGIILALAIFWACALFIRSIIEEEYEIAAFPFIGSLIFFLMVTPILKMEHNKYWLTIGATPLILLLVLGVVAMVTKYCLSKPEEAKSEEPVPFRMQKCISMFVEEYSQEFESFVVEFCQKKHIVPPAYKTIEAEFYRNKVLHEF